MPYPFERKPLNPLPKMLLGIGILLFFGALTAFSWPTEAPKHEPSEASPPPLEKSPPSEESPQKDLEEESRTEVPSSASELRSSDSTKQPETPRTPINTPSRGQTPETIETEPLFLKLHSQTQSAKSKVVPIEASDLHQAREALAAKVKVLMDRLESDPDRETAEGWIDFLKLRALQESLEKGEEGDSKEILASFLAFRSGQPGLDLNLFSDVRDALRRFIRHEQARDAQALKQQRDWALGTLPEAAATYEVIADPASATTLRTVLQWLDDIDRLSLIEADWLDDLRKPNLHVQMSERLIAAAVYRKIERPEPVRDVILGTRIRGEGMLRGTVSARLVEDSNAAAIELTLKSILDADSVGVNGPARIHSESVTRMRSTKRIEILAEGLSAFPARTEAETDSKIERISVSAGPVIRNVAHRRVYQQKDRSEQIAAMHAESRANRRMNDEIDPKIEDLNERYQQKIRQPLLARGLFPEVWDFRSTPSSMELVGLLAWEHDMGAVSPPPKPEAETDLLVQLHHSALNNLAQIRLSGAIVREEEIGSELERLFKRYAPEKARAIEKSPQRSDPPWTFTFARKGPIEVTFNEGMIQIELRIRQFEQENQRHPGMNITIRYRIENGDSGTYLSLVGKPEVFPPAFHERENPVLSAREQVIRNLLGDRLEKELSGHIDLQVERMPENWGRSGRLRPVVGRSEDAWLTLGWVWESEDE